MTLPSAAARTSRDKSSMLLIIVAPLSFKPLVSKSPRQAGARLPRNLTVQVDHYPPSGAYASPRHHNKASLKWRAHAIADVPRSCQPKCHLRLMANVRMVRHPARSSSRLRHEMSNCLGLLPRTVVGSV